MPMMLNNDALPWGIQILRKKDHRCCDVSLIGLHGIHYLNV